MNLPNENTTTMKDSMREIWQLTVKLWWQFFDWLAVVPKKTLALSMLMVLIICNMLFNDAEALIPIFAILILIRVLAGGKRRAELTADAANKRADTEQLERNLLEARMEALQAQIEPHFLFNTLASIDQLIQTDPPRASRMQQSLIRYLRYAMPQMREGSRPNLGQQTALSSAFLEIMAIRMEGRLQPEVLVPDGLKSAVFPSMMLQTLVENAIKHGLEPKAEGGRLEIKAEIRDGLLEVSVTDSGLGFAPKGAGGVGLANIRERLKVLYGNKAELVILVPLDGGTRATIRVPYEVAPQQVAPVRSEGS
ncbi:histidine kinase [Chitinimonas viridis]|uniref:Histidine kinase n=1 Tax=Chitinimonas viridis TaxID=664880 RepID=A0ABT8B1Z4_9NEIS|nr:histidine kinase [Chitinimonas viridis]MDN3576034.1 histidine kinase [Chitinimonas viridis]